VHPVFFALLPVLLFYTGNIGEVRLADLWLPLLVALLASLPVWWLCRRLARDSTRGAVLASFFWVWFFAYGHWRRWLDAHGPSSEDLGLLLYGALFAAAVVVVATRRDLKHLSGALNLIAVGLVTLELAIIGRYEAPRLWHRPEVAQARVEARAATSETARPHLFFIVLDGYARADVLADLYRYDNRQFLDFLRRRGFQIAANSRANYCQTTLSLASCLNLGYLDPPVVPGPQSTDRRPLQNLIDANRTCAFLREQGYDIVPFATGFQSTEMPGSEAHRPRRRLGALSEFQSALLSTTPLLPLLRTRLPVYVDADHLRAETVLYAFSHLPSAARSPRPTFVFAHIVNPHPPFVFHRDGTMVEVLRDTGLADGADFTGKPGVYVAGYREQMEFVNARVETMVDEILAMSARPVAIVIISDHGPGSRLDWKHLEKVDLRERFSTLVAIRLPQRHPAKLDDDISTVNVLRFVLSQCLGADLPPLPSRSYFSNFDAPYRFIEVTDAQGRYRQFGPPGTKGG